MKGKFMPTAVTIGLLIGAGLFWAILFFVNKLMMNNGLEKVNAYIANCEIIPLKVGNFTVVKGSITGFFKRTGSIYYSSTKATFYGATYRKYFSLEFMGKDDDNYLFDDFLTHYINKGDEIKATVNKTELSDTSYGTQQKPVPVFWFERETENSWNTFAQCINSSHNADTTQETEQMYRNTIAVYLTFVKSKKDFNRMFPKK